MFRPTIVDDTLLVQHFETMYFFEPGSHTVKNSEVFIKSIHSKDNELRIKITRLRSKQFIRSLFKNAITLGIIKNIPEDITELLN